MSSGQENISLLMAKCIVGTATDEERAAVDAWRRHSEHNEAAYQRLTDKGRLTVEYNRRRLTDCERPLKAMRQQLGIGRPRRRALRYLTAAAIALMVAGGAALLWNGLQAGTAEVPAPAAAIQAGRTQATLTRSNGETMQLTAETGLDLQKARPGEPSASTPTPAATASLNSLSVPRGGEFKVTLEDGTEVWLNADSRLSYPETFEGAERRVELEGEAYFRVARSDTQPFLVVSGGQEVRVYGTEFNVNAYADEHRIYTTLVEGSISLRPVDGNKSELMLTPGCQAVFSQTTASAEVHQVDTDVVTSWRSGTFVFENQTLEQIMRTLSRWYDFDYEFRDQATAQTVFMGSIPKYGSFDEVCDIFHKIGGVRLSQEGRKVIITAQ